MPEDMNSLKEEKIGQETYHRTRQFGAAVAIVHYFLTRFACNISPKIYVDSSMNASF